MKIKFQKSFLRIVELLTITLIISSSSFSANAEMDFSGTYTGLLYSSSTAEFSSSGGKDEYSGGHLKGKFGWIINDVISIEGHLGGYPKDLDALWFKDVFTYGGYIRASKDLGQYKVYGLLGATGVSYSSAYGDEGRSPVSESESGGSYGVGLEIFGSKDIAVTFEYLVMLDKHIDDYDLDVLLDTLSVGFTYYFTEDKSYFNKNRNKIKSIRY